MNEIQLIRAQLDAERDRAGAIAEACARALASADAPSGADGAAAGGLHRAGLAYLRRVLEWFDERDQRLQKLFAQLPVGGPDLGQILARGGSGREALERLGSGAREHWQEFSRFMRGPWKMRRDAIDRMLASGLRVADWRAVAAIDADSILEERHLFAQVRPHLSPRTPATGGL